jgi:hypothetical protein
MDARELYGLPLERFTEERNALARRLRQAGRRDQAAEVSKLRKPSAAAWAVNQLVRTQPRDLKALFKSGDSLRKTQAGVLAGRSEPPALRTAVEAERAAVAELLSRAQGLPSSEGQELSPAGLERVAETLHAAALDEEARALVKDGCLTRELRHVGLGGLTAAGERKGRAAPRKPPPKPKPKPKPDPAVRRAEADSRRRLERAERQLTAAQERRHRADQELQEAQRALEIATQAVEQASQEHQQALAAIEES